jgi:hypothetical protein
VRIDAVRRLPPAAWVLLPQAVSRLASVYVFAVAAHRCTAPQLGALAIATAIGSAAAVLAPAVVGKPLAGLTDLESRRDQAPMAQSAAIACSLFLSVLVALGAGVTHGLPRLALLGGAVGLPAVMVVESAYWRSAFVEGTRPAGIRLSAAYLVQAAVMTAAAVWLPPSWVVVAPFLGLFAIATVVVARQRGLSAAKARAWLTTFRRSWLPYVFGVAASISLMQAIPPVLSATAGLSAASVYRAAELAFGGTNLLVGVASQTFLTQGSTRPRRAYLLGAGLMAVVAAANGIALALLPESLLRVVLGPVTPLLLGVLALMSAQRIAFAVKCIGEVLVVPLIPARRYGTLDVAAAAVSLAALLVGGLVNGLPGALGGLAAAEVLLAVLWAVLLRRAT